MYPVFRALLFQFEPETAHHLTLLLMRLGGIQPVNAILSAMFTAPPKPVEVFGLKFKNPVGLAAGYDKDGVAVRGLSSLGFGHIEVGTVTPRPQAGNPQPRIFRLVEDEAVINRMGFPGKGMDFVAMSLRASISQRGNLSRDGRSPRGQSMAARDDTILGLNLGKNKDTPLEQAADDYVLLMQKFSPLADYLTINISSPNTVGLRRLQGREMLEQLLGRIASEKKYLARRVPILVKIAPDLSNEELDDAIEVILSSGMDGIIATNTTLARERLRSARQGESGGLSGRPLTGKSDAILAGVVKRVAGRVPIIGVGGIMSPDDARRKLDLGATLIQVYTGLIYRGPGLVQKIIQQV